MPSRATAENSSRASKAAISTSWGCLWRDSTRFFASFRRSVAESKPKSKNDSPKAAVLKESSEIRMARGYFLDSEGGFVGVEAGGFVEGGSSRIPCLNSLMP